MTDKAMIQGLLIYLLALGAAGRASLAADQAPETAIAEIQKLGGSVVCDDRDPRRPVLAVTLRNAKVTDAALQYLKGLSSLRTLDLGGARVTDAAHLKGLTHLQTLNLGSTRVTDAGVSELKKSLTEAKIVR